MLVRLERLVDEIATLHRKLILLVGPPNGGKTALLRAFGERTNTAILNVGSTLGRRLAVVPHQQRQLQAGSLLREIADQFAHIDLLLLDHLELLFDPSLQLNPLDLLKRQAHARRIIAVWPGMRRDCGNGPRLIYAEMGHPEYRDDSLDGIVTFDVQR